MRVCPQCRSEYPGGEVFCPNDGARLEGTSMVPEKARDPLVGQIVGGRYRVLRVIGEGGMGVVYEAEHTVIEKRVAVKVLRDDFSSRQDVVERFRQEAKSASRIGQENIIDISDFGETPSGASFFVMELLDGHDLAHLLNKEKTLTIQRAIPIVVQCCKALGAAHAKGIVHRDMKPENIFLTQREAFPDFVKIVDFGIAKMSDLDHPGTSGKKLTKTGMIFGTPEYMSPEQAAGKSLDHRVDIYALGVIMYELFSGRVPFVGETFMAILTQHMFETPPPIGEVNPQSQLPPALEAVIFRAMSKDPAKRQQSMAELIDDIYQALDASGLGYLRQSAYADPSRIGAPLTLRPPSAVPGGAGTVAPRPGTPVPGGRGSGVAGTVMGGPGGGQIAAPGVHVTPGPVAGPVEHAPPSRMGLFVGVAVVGAMVVLAAIAVGAYVGLEAPPDPTIASPGGEVDAAVFVPPPPTVATAADAASVVAAADTGPAAVDAAVAVVTTADAGTSDGVVQVRIGVVSRPAGAEVRVLGRGVVCETTPCSFLTARNETITLQLQRQSMTAEHTFRPSDDTPPIALDLRRRGGDRPTGGTRPPTSGGSNPPYVPPPPPPPTRRPTSGELKIPDVFRPR
ncbi:MAG: serine/threonine protein kinase [Deltaproteobacteria bacterium]|nr:serine/threonine protein kinase [Deltaproteobacteria bacterium]